MNHLTDEQLADWLAGEADNETRSHLENCPQCSAESIRLKNGISCYSIALWQQATRAQSVRLAAHLAPRRALALHRLRWAGAGVLAMLLAAQTAWMVKPRPTPPSFQPVAATPVNTPPPAVQPPVVKQAAVQMSDDELLEAVNNDLSREVPLALAPVSAITNARNKIAASTSDDNDSSNKGENR
jgi:hypothetical protein